MEAWLFGKDVCSSRYWAACGLQSAKGRFAESLALAVLGADIAMSRGCFFQSVESQHVEAVRVEQESRNTQHEQTNIFRHEGTTETPLITLIFAQLLLS